jgi:metal-responsive CopG/Arc/MetJ family transcriptional regulator
MASISGISCIFLPMLRKTLSHLIHLRLKKELLEKLDDFRFTHRFESRTETIHWLLEYALKQNPKPNK